MKIVKALLIILAALFVLALIGKAIRLAILVAFIVGAISIVMFFLKKK